jgi:hypothetical protein
LMSILYEQNSDVLLLWPLLIFHSRGLLQSFKLDRTHSAVFRHKHLMNGPRILVRVLYRKFIRIISFCAFSWNNVALEDFFLSKCESLYLFNKAFIMYFLMAQSPY